MAAKKRAPRGPVAAPPPGDNTQPIPTSGPQFAEPAPTPDPTQFTVKHGSDTAAYKILDREKATLQPRPFPVVDQAEPTVTLADAIGPEGESIEDSITAAAQIVFHALGDTGNTKGPRDEGLVADKMVSDFSETDSRQVPSFCYHLGDVVYSFGEAEYYYDQFYDPFRDYPAPIFAIAGNHDGMVAPNSTTPTLEAFLENFCTAGQAAHRTPEAGGLARTAQVQPAVYFTLEAPFVRILGLYSNCLEDPGIISDQGGKYPYLGQTQIQYLTAALTRIKQQKFKGAILIAVHHPPYVAQIAEAESGAPAASSRKRSSAEPKTQNAGRHGGSPVMLEEIDAVCESVGVWPHAILSGHAHNYQRFTRSKDGRQTPFIVAGNGGHAVSHLTKKGTPALRVPSPQAALTDGSDSVVFENYDDQDFGYLRILVNAKQLRIEYHPATDGEAAKTPDDAVTVDLQKYQLVHFQAAGA
jgi:hypothetical protein